MKIEGTAAVVFGGASGLGAAAARRLAELGARVVIADVNVEAGTALAEQLPGSALFSKTDVSRSEEVEAAVASAAALSPSVLRLCVNCAGIARIGRVADRRGPGTLNSFREAVEINLVGSYNALRFAASAMMGNQPDAAGERGVCINTASVAAFDGQIGQIAYSASKGGVAAMTLPAARDLGPSNIRVNTIAPGVFDTPMVAGLPEQARAALVAQIPAPHRLGHPDEYAQLVCHIAENGMLNGEIIRLDGGIRMPAR